MIFELEQLWLYYNQYKKQYWDALDFIEDLLAKEKTITSIEVNKQMWKRYRKGERTIYEKGKIPENVTKILEKI